MRANGLTLGGNDREDIVEHVELAEKSGLETYWQGESWGQSSVPVMTRLVEQTELIDVCSGIFNVYTRSPALVAMTANTLADMSGGRFRVGLGMSGPTVIENFHGVEFEAPLRRTREYVEIVRAYLEGERVEYDGELFDLSGFALDMDQTYDCPIYVAAMGEVNRQLTGEFADGWIPLLLPNTAVEEALEAVVRGTERGDRSIADVDVAPWVPTCISETDPDAAVECIRSMIAFYVGAMGEYYAEMVGNFGFEEEATAVQAGWEEDTQSGAEHAVTDEMVSTIGACGTPEQAAASFESFVDAGADSPVAYIPSQWTTDNIVRETITHL